MWGEFDQNHSNELRDATRSCDVRRDFHHLTLIWTNVNVKSSTSVLGRACFHWQASLPWWFLLAHLASSRPSLCSAAHILNVGWPIETARCVRGGAMAINQRRVILRQSGGMQFLSVKANLEEVKKKKLATQKVVSLLKLLKWHLLPEIWNILPVSLRGDELVLPVDWFPTCCLAIEVHLIQKSQQPSLWSWKLSSLKPEAMREKKNIRLYPA